VRWYVRDLVCRLGAHQVDDKIMIKAHREPKPTPSELLKAAIEAFDLENMRVVGEHAQFCAANVPQGGLDDETGEHRAWCAAEMKPRHVLRLQYTRRVAVRSANTVVVVRQAV
jgi:hypothetical protein